MDASARQDDVRRGKLLLGRTAAILYGSGALTGFLAAALADWPGFVRAGILAPASVALIAAAAFFAFAERLPHWVFHASPFLGSVLITAGVASAGRGGGATFAILYLFVTVYVSCFFSWTETLVFCGVIGALYGGVVALDGEPAALVRWMIVVGSCVGAGAVVSWLVSERRRIERVLDRQGHGFRLLFANNPLPMWVHDDETLRFIEVNDAAIQRYGFARDEFLSMHITDIRPPQEAERLLGELEREPRERSAMPSVWTHRTKEGREFPVQTTAHPMIFRDRPAILVVAEDISERCAAEEALRRSEEWFRSLVQNASEMMIVCDADTTVRYVSPAVERILGIRPDDILGDRGGRFIHPEDLPSVIKVAEQAMRSPGTQPAVEFRVRHRTGYWRYVESTLTNLLEDPYVRGIVVNARDVTDRHEAEQALLDAYDREHEAAERLRGLDELKNGILQAVSHELRTPLGIVLGLALTLRDKEGRLPPATVHDMVQRLARNARRLERLLAGLLDLDRLLRGILEPNRQPTELRALVERVVIESELTTLDLVVEGDPVVASVDPAKVERIVENLLMNAVRHTPDGTRVWVRVRREDGGVLILVEDDGPGVPAEMHDVVFEPFRHGDTPAYAPGTGIGLSLVAQFAKLHGGRAWVEERNGGGASFRVLLPDPSDGRPKLTPADVA